MDPNSLEILVPPDKLSFKISLGDIDLSLLHNYETTVPLYTLQSREYIDFEVYAQEILRLPDGENVDNEEDLRQCHICEVDVPVSYWECHKASSKHQVYNAITQISLDRLRKQMESDVLPLRPSTPRASTYYCETCSQAVHCTQQDSHNESNEHVTNKNLDEMIEKLMLVYKNPADITKISCTTKSSQNQADQVAIKDEKHDPLIKTSNKLDWWDEVFLYPKKVNPLTAHKIHYIDNNTVAIITESEAKLAVNFDNFHGLRKDKSKIVCLVCYVSVDDKYKHINDDGHIKKITATIEDKHCIRQLAPKSNHCILCNEITDNREEHISSERHESFLKQATIDDVVYQDMKEDFERYDTKINTQQIWWDKVFLYPKKVNPKTAHKIQYIDDSTIEVDVKSGAKLAVNFDNFHGFCEDAEKIICRVCRALVDDKYKHMDEDGHIKKITAAIEDKHCIRRLDQIFNHCILCNEIIENSEVHISTDRHEAAVNECMIDDSNERKKTLTHNSMSVSSFDKRVYFCNACQMYVEQNSLSRHINEEYHTEALEKSKKKKWGFQSWKKIAANEYCAICNVHVTGGKKALKAHKKTDDHKYLKWLPKINTKLHHHLMKIKFVDNVTCQVCKIIIPADKQANDEHIASLSHQDVYKQLLQQNKMETLDHKYISCHACNTRVLIFEDLNHIQNKKHRKRLEKKKMAAVPLQNGIDEKVTSAKSQEIIQNGVQMKGNDGYCIYCNVTVEQKYIDEHIKTEWHVSSKSKHEQVGNETPSNIVSQDDNDSGQLVAQPTNLKEDVINTRKALLEKLKEEMFDGDYCTVCRVPVKATEQSRKKHTIWTDHRYKFYLHAMEENSRWHYHMKETVGLDNLTCKICHIQVKLDNECVQRHIDSEDHVAKFRSLTGNLIEKISESRVRCRLCNLILSILDEISHFSTKKHKKNLRERGSVYGILGTFNTENESLNSDDPEKVEDIDEEKMRSNEIIKTGTEYFCNACRVTVEHNFVDIHIDSDMHRINISKNVPKKENNIQENIAVKPKRNKTLHYVYDFDYKFDVRCKICNVGVTFDRMVKHRQEESHKEKFRNVLAMNTMFRIHYISFCECCMEIVTLNLEYEHFMSEKHANNLLNLTNRMDRKKVLEIAESMFRKYDSDYCRVRKKKKFNPVPSPEGSGTVADESVNSSISVGSEKDYHLPNETFVFNTSTVDCTDININLDADKLDCSESGSSFASALTSITETNPSNTMEVAADKNDVPHDASLRVPPTYTYLFREENPKQLNCQVCKSSVSIRCDLIIEHVQGKKHRKKYLSLLAANYIKEYPCNRESLQKYHCSKCGIDFPDTELFRHVNSRTHCIEVNQPSASLPQPGTHNDDTVFNFIPDIPMYFWCDSHNNDPFYLLSTISQKSKFPPTLDSHLSNSTKQNIAVETPIYYWLESYDNDPLFLLSTISQTSKLPSLLDTPSPSNENVKQNSTPGMVNGADMASYLYEHYDPAHVMSTIVHKSVSPEIVDKTEPKTKVEHQGTTFSKNIIDDWSDESTELNSHPVSPDNTFSNILRNNTESRSDGSTNQNSQLESQCISASTYYLYEHYDPARLMSTIVPNAILSGKMVDKQSNESTKQNEQIESHDNTHLKYLIYNQPHEAQPEDQENIFSKVLGDNRFDVNMKPNVQPVSHTFSTNILRDNTESRSDESTKQSAHLEHQGNTQREKVLEEEFTTTTKSAPGTSQSQTFFEMFNKLYRNDSFDSKPSIVDSYCHVCQVKLPNGTSGITIHVTGDRHRKNLEKHIKTTNTAPLKPPVKNSGSVPTNYVVNGFCSVCKVKVPTRSNNIAEHVKEANHIENVAIAEKRQIIPDPAHRRPLVAGNSGSVPTNHVVNGFCSVCKVKVPTGSNAIAEHVKGANHLENVAIAEKRKKTTYSASATYESQKDLVVYNSVPNSNERLCTICNVKVSNSNQNLYQHLKGALHRENLDKLEMFDLIPTNERLCKICKVKVPNKADNIDEHLKGQNHKRNAEIGLSETKNTAMKAVPKEVQPVLLTKLTTSSNSSHLRYIREGVYCDLCNVNMTNLGSVVSHLNSEEHVSFSRKCKQEHLASETARVPDLVPASVNSVSRNNSTSISTSADTSRTNSRDSSAMRQAKAYTCKICSVEVPNTPNNISDHIAGNRHKANVSKLNSTKDIITVPKGQNLSLNKQNNNIAKVSEITINNSQVPSDGNINKPSTSYAQNNKYCNIITPTTSDNTKAENKNTATDSENEDGFYICKICKALVDNNPTAINAHLNSYKHKSNTQEQKEKMKEELQEQKLYFCEVCRCEMLDNPIKIKAHNDSLCHTKKFLNLLSFHKIRIRDNKVCYCELCDLYFNKFSVLSHIEREIHKKNMA